MSVTPKPAPQGPTINHWKPESNAENTFSSIRSWFKPSGETVGEGGGAECTPDIFHQEIFADLPGKKGLGRKGKLRGKAGKFERGGKLKMEGGKHENERRTLLSLSLLLLLLFCLSLFETTEICLGSTSPPPPDNFYRENHISRREKNSGKLTWAPFEKYSSYATAQANRLCIFARDEKSEHHLELFSCLVLLKYSYVILNFLAIQISRQFGWIVMSKLHCHYANAEVQPSVQYWPY